MEGAETDVYTRHWRLVILLIWLAMSGLLIYSRWRGINGFALGDTDDNMRMMQVRALLNGQGWFDLRNYRMDPPLGANIHWSRIVDLPIAGIMLALRPIFGGQVAEKVAVAIAPLLPMVIALFSMALISRRMLSPKAFALGAALLLCAHSARGMWTPLRIDHHGWQLAMLSLSMWGLVDPKRARGGILMGVSTAVSLSIGLELLIYLAALGVAAVLLWVRDEEEKSRLLGYGASLAGGCALGYLLFASYANRLPVCDALSPVWLSAMVGAGAIAVLLAMLPLRSWPVRLGAALLLGAILAGGFALAWPNCLGRPEGASPELQRMWLNNVREARPLYTHDRGTIAAVAALPIVGLVGYLVMIVATRRDRELCARWAALGFAALATALTLLWQSRAGAAAQVLAVPGCAGLGWISIPRIQKLTIMPVRVIGTVAAFVIISGLGAQYVVQMIPEKQSKQIKAVNRANGSCPTLGALHPVALQPKGVVLTFVDLGPRLITVTHHDAIAGPYHRNGAAILDVMKAFRGTPDFAHAVIARHHADYVLICPGMSESTMYEAAAPQGFYMQLANAHAPAWLQPVELPKKSPFKMWRVVKS